jgi:hypothetical protein
LCPVPWGSLQAGTPSWSFADVLALPVAGVREALAMLGKIKGHKLKQRQTTAEAPTRVALAYSYAGTGLFGPAVEVIMYADKPSTESVKMSEATPDQVDYHSSTEYQLLAELQVLT